MSRRISGTPSSAGAVSDLADGACVPSFATGPKGHVAERGAPEGKVSGNTLKDADLPGTLRAVLAPYLSAGRPSVGLASEIAGLSRGIFQRRLAEQGLSYSKLLDQCAFNVA